MVSPGYKTVERQSTAAVRLLFPADLQAVQDRVQVRKPWSVNISLLFLEG